MKPGSWTRTSVSGVAVFWGLKCPASRVTCQEPEHTGTENGRLGREKYDLDDFIVIAFTSREVYACSTHNQAKTRFILFKTSIPKPFETSFLFPSSSMSACTQISVKFEINLQMTYSLHSVIPLVPRLTRAMGPTSL